MERTFTGYLSVNFKTGKIVVVKRTPIASPYTITVRYKLKVEIPERKIQDVDFGTAVIPEVYLKSWETGIPDVGEPFNPNAQPQE